MKQPRTYTIKHAFFGRPYSDQEVKDAIGRRGMVKLVNKAVTQPGHLQGDREDRLRDGNGWSVGSRAAQGSVHARWATAASSPTRARRR